MTERHTRGVSGGRRSWPGWTGVALTAAGVAVMAGLVLIIPELREAVAAALRGDTDRIRDELDELGAWGPLLVLALALIHAVVFYPAEILDAAAGFVYGFAAALPLVMAGWLLNAAVAYAIGRRAARPLLQALLGAGRLARAEAFAERGGVTLLLAMRLIPIVPFSLFSYAAGAARVPPMRFMWTTAIGYLPITAIFIYLGSRLEELSLTDPLLWASMAALLAMLLAVRWLAPRSEAEQRRG
jgi:uncharacterized membrane protein YdjX (TVP38/TMEM64 family)